MLDLTSFTVRATVAHARDVLKDRRHVVINDAAWTEFNALLDRPVQFKEATSHSIRPGSPEGELSG